MIPALSKIESGCYEKEMSTQTLGRYLDENGKRDVFRCVHFLGSFLLS